MGSLQFLGNLPALQPSDGPNQARIGEERSKPVPSG